MASKLKTKKTSKKQKAKKPVKSKRKAPKAQAKAPRGHRLLNFKASGKDRKAILKLARKHAHGNYSAWLRHAGLNYRPKKGEVIR